MPQRLKDKKTTANSVLPQLAVKCNIEAECYYQTFVLGDSEVLRNRQLRQHANRYTQQYFPKFALKVCRKKCFSYSIFYRVFYLESFGLYGKFSACQISVCPSSKVCVELDCGV
ncbi:hypothetical protein EZL74_10775 [Flavobacterium silvisoli]|uniref:Uncharacterized protein n=1 Tax=Flavobacterium silvisoli TaxID=2529433 RepID=A0A4Q9YYW6_9FLAO|nr:hypothetical protein EZL74_10775 [Flavobacterium silvisoli]